MARNAITYHYYQHNCFQGCSLQTIHSQCWPYENNWHLEENQWRVESHQDCHYLPLPRSLLWRLFSLPKSSSVFSSNIWVSGRKQMETVNDPYLDDIVVCEATLPHMRTSSTSFGLHHSLRTEREVYFYLIFRFCGCSSTDELGRLICHYEKTVQGILILFIQKRQHNLQLQFGYSK